MRNQERTLLMMWLFPVLIFSACWDRTDGVYITAQYPTGNEDTISWNNLAVDPVTGSVYAGGVNYLFHLDEDLVVVESVNTGPFFDDQQCFSNFSGNPCLSVDSNPVQSTLTDNYNQVLVVDGKHRQLVTCGSIFQGTCQTRSLSNISISADYPSQFSEFSQFVIVASRIYPTVAFVGPGPFGDDVLYVGTANPGVGRTEWLLTKYLSGISSRNLTYPGTFLVTEVDTPISWGTRAFLTEEAATKYRITYVAGFSLKGFSYFLTRQPEPFSPSVVSDVITSKLVQVCQADKYFDSYVEMRITCSSGGVDYNLIQAAVFVQPGSILSRDLGLMVDEDVLVGVFSTSNQSNLGSALCVFPLSNVRQAFTQNIQRCYNSSTLLVGPQFSAQNSNRKCQQAFTLNIDDSFCGSMVQTLSFPRSPNSPLVGSIPLAVSSPALVLPRINVTAVNATTVDNHTVLFMGTADGKLLKVLLDSKRGTVYESSEVGGSAVNQDLLLSGDRSHLYLMTSKKKKVPTATLR